MQLADSCRNGSSLTASSINALPAGSQRRASSHMVSLTVPTGRARIALVRPSAESNPPGGAIVSICGSIRAMRGDIDDVGDGAEVDDGDYHDGAR